MLRGMTLTLLGVHQTLPASTHLLIEFCHCCGGMQHIAFLQEHAMWRAAHIAQVPKHQPRSRDHWSEWTLIWPLTWRQPTYESGLSPQTAPLTSTEQQQMAMHMERALQLHADHASARNAAVIVDPCSNFVVAEGVDARHKHPLRHAVLAALDAAAKWSLTHWPEAATGAAACAQRHNGTAIDSTAGDQVHAGGEVLSAQHGLEGARKRARVSCTAQRAPEQPVDSNCDVNVHARRPAQQAQPYLCTGFDCYMVREPCVMCAMALTHSRLRRVVYSQSDASGGALGGALRLHGEPSLNHHFDVYCWKLG